MSEWIIVIGALTAVSITIPQFRLVVTTKDTHGLSLTAWVVGLGGQIGWLAHGIILAEFHMIWPNTWNLFVAITMLYFLRRNGSYRSLTTLLPGLGLGALLVGLDLGVGSAAFGIVIVAPQAYSMTRQGLALMRAPQVSGVSIASWVFQVANQLVWLVWSLMTWELGTLISAVVSLAASGFTLTWRILRACGVGPVGSKHAPVTSVEAEVTSVEAEVAGVEAEVTGIPQAEVAGSVGPGGPADRPRPPG